ncbi:MAG TPA: ABC transporter substrate-binding protein [Ilumatobacter sp.]|nr:ABC transporter substrate-binding protein [Ilumatobacter sp.]
MGFPQRTGRLALVGVIALLAAACGDDEAATDTTAAASADTTAETTAGTTSDSTIADAPAGEIPAGPTIIIGAQDFGESAILAEIYGQALSAAGYPVEQQALGGYRDLVFTAFEGGDINFTAEYAASAVDFLVPGTATGDIAETAAALQTELTPLGLVALEASSAVDSNSFVVTPETAATLEAQTVSSLTDDLTLGGPPDCPDNASCIPGLIETYGIDLSANFVPLDGGGPLTVAALEGGEIDVAILFSTDGIIADKGWVVLEDDLGLINADNIIPITNDEVFAAYGADFADLVNAISAALTTEELTELNRQFGIDKEDADAVATAWLTTEGLL